MQKHSDENFLECLGSGGEEVQQSSRERARWASGGRGGTPGSALHGDGSAGCSGIWSLSCHNTGSEGVSKEGCDTVRLVLEIYCWLQTGAGPDGVVEGGP